MKNLINKIIEWLSQSNRGKHLVGGIVIGAGANDIYCAAYAGIGIAGALEFKDYQWGGKPDWIDFILTVSGVAIGFTLRLLLFNLLFK